MPRQLTVSCSMIGHSHQGHHPTLAPITRVQHDQSQNRDKNIAVKRERIIRSTLSIPMYGTT